MSFAAILALCAFITGIMAAIDRFYIRKQSNVNESISWVFEQGRSFFPVFLIVLVLRSFLFEPFRIPSSSLEPTLLVGDFVLVNKFSYGLRIPVIDKLFVPLGTPQRGDIVVFSWPPNDKYDYIKRVIGIPGDKISYHNKILTINGVEIKQTNEKATSFIDEQGVLQNVDLYTEDLLSVKHSIYRKPAVPAFDFEVTVPEGKYFVMGDNRDNSSDSRFWGFVSDKNLRGKAVLIWMSWNSEKTTVRWSRLGQAIH